MVAYGDCPVVVRCCPGLSGRCVRVGRRWYERYDGGVRMLRTEADEPGWEVDPDDEWGVAVVATVGRQLKLRREAVGMRAGEFGKAVGYGEDLVYKIAIT